MSKRQGDALNQSLAALSSYLLGDTTLRQTLKQVIGLGQVAIPGAQAVGLTLLDDGRPTTAVCTSEEAAAIDQIQYDRDEGPCLQAYRDKRVYRVDSNRTEKRWPAYARGAAALGVLSSLSLPLVAAGNGIGAMNIYARSEAAFGEGDEGVGLAFAAQAAVLLANAQAYWGAQTLAAQLDEAMQSRAVIEQAKGILISRSGVSADDAFAQLAKASQRENRKLRDIATELVERHQHQTVAPS